MIVASLFDESGNAVRDWAKAGATCYCVDIDNEPRVAPDGIIYLRADLRNPTDIIKIIDLKPDFISAFPPCTDLASSGSGHWARKAAINPEFQQHAMELVLVAQGIANVLNVPFYVENPIGRASTLWRKPDFIFNPFEYGGYLPANDVHPRFPQYILPRDAYPKRTCIWHGNGFTVPDKKPVPKIYTGYAPQHLMLGGGMKNAAKIRSETPRGWARAVFEANYRA